MATDIKIDPVTRDFVDDDQGGWVEADDSSTAMFCQLDCEEGKWWGDPRSGSQIKEILRSDLPTSEAINDAARRAGAQLVQAGMVSDLHVTALDEDNARGYAEQLVQWRDRASNKPADLAYSPLGGNPPVT